MILSAPPPRHVNHRWQYRCKWKISVNLRLRDTHSLVSDVSQAAIQSEVRVVAKKTLWAGNREPKGEKGEGAHIIRRIGRLSVVGVDRVRNSQSDRPPLPVGNCRADSERSA